MMDKTRNQIISTITKTLADKSTPIGKELLKLPQSVASSIAISADVCPFNIGSPESPIIHWAIYLQSPHPDDLQKHRAWMEIATHTPWYQDDIGLGEAKKVTSTCRGCKGQDHSTYKCPLHDLPEWNDLFPNSMNKNSANDMEGITPMSIQEHENLTNATLRGNTTLTPCPCHTGGQNRRDTSSYDIYHTPPFQGQSHNSRGGPKCGQP